MVKWGISSYSLFKAMEAKEMTIMEVIDWVAGEGAEHIEIVPLGFSLDDNPELTDAIRQRAKDAGIEISNYAIGANFAVESEEAFENEVRRVQKQVDIAHRLGVKLMRHDVAYRAREAATIVQFEADLENMVRACRQVADYAAQFGITTSVENHGYLVQASDRVQRLVHAVNRENFRTTLDVGNFTCADENTLVAVKKNLPIASMVHLKDFYVRRHDRNPGKGWFPSQAGSYLRGAIVGQGDLDMWETIRLIKQSGYDGYISIEFEGLEECKFGARTGLDNAKRIWDEV